MKNTLYVKALAIAIAASFLVMAGNGLGNSEQINEVLMAEDLLGVMQAQNLDTIRINERLGDLPNLAPPIETPESVVFDDSFEDDVLGDAPDDPPWAVTEQASTVYGGWGPDEFEDDIVGQDPDAPWQTIDGASSTVYWGVDHEDCTAGPLDPAYYAAEQGSYIPIAGDATLTAEAPQTGAPPGSIWPGRNTGTMCARFQENTDTNAQSAFGPWGIDPTGTMTDGYCGAWFYHYSLTASTFFYLYQGSVGSCIIMCFDAGNLYYVSPAMALVAVTGSTYAINTWHEMYVEYHEATKTFDVWYDGVERMTALGWTYPAQTDIDSSIIVGGEFQTSATFGPSNVNIDNWNHIIPPSGGAHAISVSNAYSSSIYGGTQSVLMDQNNYATTPASATVHFLAPYAWGAYAGCSWAVMTDTVANTNGARFLFKDYNDRILMAMRFSGGNIQYQTGATWTTIQAFTANTEYHFDLWMDAAQKTYGGLYVDETVFYDLTGMPLVNLGAGIATFQAIATVSTQSTVYFDHVTMWGELQDGTVRVSDAHAHTGSQSVRMWEANGDDYCNMAAYLGGDLCTYGEFWFWFYGDGTLGGGSVDFYDTTGTYPITTISLGYDLTGGGIPQPGFVKWVDGDGAGAGWIVDGPAITANTWNNISIRYNTIAKTFEARWNGALQGTFAFRHDGALDGGIVAFWGEGPAAPSDWFFDDIGLWVDDLPATPQNLHTDFPPAVPSTEAWYTVNQDNAVEGAVTGTFANIDEITPLDGLTEDILEATIPGGSGAVTYNYVGATTAGPHDAYWLDLDDSTPAELTAPNTRTEATNAQYTNIAVSENTRWAGVAPGGGDETGWEYIYNIAEAPATITSIDLTFEGQWAAAGCVVTCFAWNAVGSTWDTIGATMTFTTINTDYTMTRSITTNPSNYVSGGAVRCVFYGSSSNVISRADYARCIINWAIPPTYSLEHRWRTQNVPAGADIMEVSITARTSAGSDDTFPFGIATVLTGPYTMFTTVNSATLATYTAAISPMSGVLYINVVDSNAADAAADTIYIDAISIHWTDFTGTTTSTQDASADNPVEGTVVGTYALTNPPADAPPDTNSQQFTEVDSSSVPTDPIEIKSSLPGPTPMVDIMPAESFETAVPPTGWSVINGPGTRHWQQAVDGTPYPTDFGGFLAYVNYDSAYAQDEWLITPSLDCSLYQNVALTFHIVQGTAWDDYIYIRASTDGGGTWSGNLATYYRSGLTLTAADMQTLDLSAYDFTPDLQIAFILWTAAPDAGDSVGLDQVTLVGDVGGTTLEHVWTLDSLPDNAMARYVNVRARYSTGSDDNFQFGWSQDVGGPFTPVTGLFVSSDSYTTYTGTIPVDFSGPFYMNVIDTNGADTTYSTLYVDSLYVQSLISPYNTSVNVIWDLSADDGAGQNDVIQYNVYYSDAEIGGNEMGTYNYLGSVPAGTGIYKHYGENKDMVNNIWYIVTAQDPYSEGFSTMRATKFNVAPEAQNVMVDSATFVEVTAGTPVTLTANIFDDSSTWEDILKLDGAEWYADTDPGAGLGTPMTGDGLWDSTFEPCTATIDTTGWTVGSHQIFVRGHEHGPGNTGTGWGAVSGAVLINITGGPTPYNIDLTGIFGDQWVFVSFPVEVTGNIEDVLNDATLGDGLTTWDVAKWCDAQDAMDPWKTYRFGSTVNDMPAINNQMGIWVHLVTNGGDTMLTLGITGNLPAGTVMISLYTGWNLVGYPSMSNAMGDASLPMQADYVSTWTATSPYIVDQVPGAVMLSNGHGYWVHVTVDCTWTVNP